MKREADVKELLISNAIHLIAEGGFEKATTKQLTLSGGHLSDFKMNEVYIYRIFGSKENLYEAAFLRLDYELFDACIKGVNAVGGFEEDTRERFYAFFLSAWRFVMAREERCRCYVRYYYSIYFSGNSVEAHNKHFLEVIKTFSPVFIEEADVNAIMHSVFSVFLDFAIRVFNGQLSDDEINRPHIFNVLYCMMMTYFKESVRGS